MASFLDITLRVCRTTKEGEAPSCHFPTPPAPAERLRSRGLGRWRLRWRRSKGPRQNAEGSRVRPRHGAARNPCEGSARAPRYRFLCSVFRNGRYFSFFTSIYSLSLLQASSVVPHLYYGHCILVRVALYFNNSNGVSGIGLRHPPPFLPLGIISVILSFGWIVLAQDYTALMSTSITPASLREYLTPSICLRLWRMVDACGGESRVAFKFVTLLCV